MTPLLRALVVAIPCVLATACSGPTHDVARMRVATYSTEPTTVSALVRDALAAYPIVDHGNGQFETRWMRDRGEDAFQFVIHVDGPGEGPFTVTVDTRMREEHGGHVITETVDNPPAWLAARRDRVVATIYDRLKLFEVHPAPEMVATQ